MKQLQEDGPATIAYDAALDHLVDTASHSYAEARVALGDTKLEAAMLLEQPAAPRSVLSLGQAADVLAWYHAGTTRPTKGQLDGLGSSMARVGSPANSVIKDKAGNPLLTHTEAAAAAEHLNKK